MADKRDETENEEPLDPAMERVRRKMIRLLAISIGTMLVGLVAVLGAVVYKAGQTDAPEGFSQKDFTLPPGFAISDTALSQNRVLLRGSDADGADRILIYDTETGDLVGNHALR